MLYPAITGATVLAPRLQFLDTGLVNHSLGIQAEMLAMDDLNSACKGAVIPHLIAQELISLQSISAHTPNFWVSKKAQSNAEVDLLYAYNKLVIPIEIKSGSNGTLKSLHQFIEAADHPYAIRMYAGALKIENAVTPNKKPYLLMNLPYYAGTALPQYIEWFVQHRWGPDPRRGWPCPRSFAPNNLSWLSARSHLRTSTWNLKKEALTSRCLDRTPRINYSPNT